MLNPRRAAALPLLLVTALLAACSGSSAPPAPLAEVVNPPATGTPSGPPVAGKSTDVAIPSKVDGANISFTIHEPTQVVPGARYPLILEGHGYGGNKVAASERPAKGDPGTFGRLLDAGYAVLSIDMRGFGSSGGRVRILDPDFEGKDLLQILDWAEANLPYLAYRNNNLLLGAIGGSYGGGFQHLIYAIDPKKRLDAIAPEITWYDLRYSLFSGTTFKSYWATLLSAVGNSAGGQDTIVNQELARGLVTNSISEEGLALLYKNSMASHCKGENAATAGGRLTPIDALYWQSSRDTLFNMNDLVKNVECVSALGGDVRMLIKINGHDLGTGESCGALQKTQSIVDWYDEKLKGAAGKAAYIPRYCFELGETAGDGVVTTSMPKATGNSFQVPAQSVVALQNSLAPAASVVLMRAGAGGAILAGLPKIDITIADAAAGAVGDPIVFVGLGIRRAGASADTLAMANQVRPFRGYGSFSDELNGLTVRLAENDEVRLLIYPGFTSRYPLTGTKIAAPVNVSATVSLPLLPGNLPAPPKN
jgi:ABC-2 type transport system ATP-binding protein